jgi:hypothetical protein
MSACERADARSAMQCRKRIERDSRIVRPLVHWRRFPIELWQGVYGGLRGPDGVLNGEDTTSSHNSEKLTENAKLVDPSGATFGRSPFAPTLPDHRVA